VTGAGLCAGQRPGGVWVQARGTDLRMDGNRGAPDTHDRAYGFLAGADRAWGAWTVGGAAGYDHTDVTESGHAVKASLDALRLAAYGARTIGNLTFAGTVGYAYTLVATSRPFGGLGHARGDGHGQEFTAAVQ